jgi:hypothetical protein
VRVSQNPGGNSSLSLADHHIDHIDEERDVKRVVFVESSYTNIAMNIVDTDTAYFSNEDTVIGLSPLVDSLRFTSSGRFAVSSNFLSVDKPFSPIVKNSLGLAVKVQSELLDQAALYSTIRGARLLEHIDNFEDTFLISPKGSFLLSFCSSLIEKHLERYPFRLSGGLDSNKKYEYSKYKIDRLWNEKAAKTSFDRIRRFQNSNQSGSIFFNRSALESKEGDVASDVLWRHLPWESVFSAVGIQSMFIDYIVSFPLSAIFSSDVLFNFSKVMQKLLELVQLSVLLKILWNEIRGLRVVQRNAHTDKNKFTQSHIDREIFHSYRTVLQTVNSLYDYAVDRVRCIQIDFKKSIRASASRGYGVLYNLMEEYSSNLCSSLFIDFKNNSSDYDENETTLTAAIDCSLDLCRRSLKALMKLLLAVEESKQSTDYLLELSNLRTEISELNRCNQALMTKADDVSRFSEQVNAKMLTKFFILKGSFN